MSYLMMFPLGWAGGCHTTTVHRYCTLVGRPGASVAGSNNIVQTLHIFYQWVGAVHLPPSIVMVVMSHWRELALSGSWALTPL